MASLALQIEASYPNPAYPHIVMSVWVLGCLLEKLKFSPGPQQEVPPARAEAEARKLAQRLRPERKHKQRGDDLTFNGTALGLSRAAKQTSYAKLQGGAVTQTTRRWPLFPPFPQAYD